MTRSAKAAFFIVYASLAIVRATVNVWPSENPAYDDIEEIYTITEGVGSSGFAVDITPCSNAPSSDLTSGRQSAAEWIRL